MKNKKLMTILLVVLIAVILCALAIRFFAGNKDSAGELPTETPATASETNVESTTAESTDTENAAEGKEEAPEISAEPSDDAHENEGATILESDGEIEIIVQEGEDTYGE